jgi:Lipoprotein amino terminal region
MMCGSNPSFLLIKNWVETGVIQGEEAAQVISALPSYMLKPSRKMLQKFFEMVQEQIGAKDQRVRIASLISFSHLLRITCADRQKQVTQIPLIQKR